jgi:hypothetical protein
MDGSSVSAEEENFESLETEGSWTKYMARIPLASEVDTFSWNIGKGTTGFYFT